MPTEAQIQEAGRRQRLLSNLSGLLAQGFSLNRAAGELGEPAANLSRYRRDYLANGFDGLMPKYDQSGRKPLVSLTPDEQIAVQKLVAQTDPNTSTRISTSLALRLFAHSDQCRQEVADVILKPRSSKHTLTRTLKRQAKITPETKLLDRGDRAFELGGYSQPRALVWIDLRGEERPIEPGDIFERDDMTVNQPWYVEWNDPADPCAAKYGVRLVRGQLLVEIDVASQRILSFELLARPQDSYRAEDIWAWIGRGYRDHGLPRIGERMERGIWEAKAIHGIPIVDETWGHETRMGGLAALGVAHIPSFSPKTKSIESLFNNLQKILGTAGVQVGRKQGEFERANKDWMACRAGKKHPKDCGFLHADELVRRIEAACHFLNQDCREGEVYKGIPDELWAASLAVNPLREMDVEKGWVFLPRKAPVTVRSGMVRARVASAECSFYFCNPELFAALGSGYKVIAAFDPAVPDVAVIFNAESGARDVLQAGPGGLLGTAELVESVPQYSALDGLDERAGIDRRKRFSNQCRMAYRALGLRGQRLAASAVVRDGRGREVRMEGDFTTKTPRHQGAGEGVILPGGCGVQGDPAPGLMLPHEAARPAIHLPASRPQISADELAAREAEFMEKNGIFA